MESKTIPAVFGLNRVLWAQINELGILDKANYGGLIPIIPVQEAPQFIAAMDGQEGIMSWPYIVYNWYTNTIDATSWYKQTDTVTYTIYAIDQKKLRDLVLVVMDMFKRYDDSAQVVNSYIRRAYPPTSPGGIPDQFVDGPQYGGYEYRCYHYNYIYVVSANSSAPQTAENDPAKATITLRVNYTDTRNDQPLTIPGIPT